MINNKQKLTQWIIILTSLLIIPACSEEKKSVQETAGSTKKIEAPSIDIHTAVISNNIDAIKLHIKAGTDLNSKEPMAGATPLITAVVFDKIEISKLLIEAGVNLNIKNNDGSTALISAAFFCRTDVLKLLIKSGADKTVKNNFDQTAFEAVSIDFSAVKPVYEMMGKMLGPMGINVDLDYLEKTRPLIAELLK